MSSTTIENDDVVEDPVMEESFAGAANSPMGSPRGDTRRLRSDSRGSQGAPQQFNSPMHSQYDYARLGRSANSFCIPGSDGVCKCSSCLQAMVTSGSKGGGVISSNGNDKGVRWDSYLPEPVCDHGSRLGLTGSRGEFGVNYDTTKSTQSIGSMSDSDSIDTDSRDDGGSVERVSPHHTSSPHLSSPNLSNLSRELQSRGYSSRNYESGPLSRETSFEQPNGPRPTPLWPSGRRQGAHTRDNGGNAQSRGRTSGGGGRGSRGASFDSSRSYNRTSSLGASFEETYEGTMEGKLESNSDEIIISGSNADGSEANGSSNSGGAEGGSGSKVNDGRGCGGGGGGGGSRGIGSDRFIVINSPEKSPEKLPLKDPNLVDLDASVAKVAAPRVGTTQKVRVATFR